MSIQYLRSYKEKSIPDRLCRWDFPEELAGTRSYFKIRPSVPIVYTCHGINFPLAISAFFTAASIPPQHGTSMRTTVTLWISLLRMISVSFSELVYRNPASDIRSVSTSVNEIRCGSFRMRKRCNPRQREASHRQSTGRRTGTSLIWTGHWVVCSPWRQVQCVPESLRC